MPLLRVVADTNVLVSALHAGGNPQLVLDRASRGQIDLYLSPFILQELSAALASRKFRWTATRIAEALRVLPAQVIDPGAGRLHVVRDEADNRILECALAARADWLVTGDRDLLQLKTYRRIKIVLPAEFLRLA
jgi:putative PIN family toxin of toxin-antitoxin system